MGSRLHFDYTASQHICEQLGLVWLGDEWVKDADNEAWVLGFDQTQMDAAMKHTLIHVKRLFTPSIYTYWQRILIALYFLTGWRPR